jgi:Holliday junction resolvase RusA-like endonuclease
MQHSSYILYGDPKAKTRVRASRAGRSGIRFFDDQKGDKSFDRIQVMKQMRAQGHLKLLREPISVEMYFHLRTPKKCCQRALKGKPKPTKPDIDNLAKYYLDMLNKLVYEDDRFITGLRCEKIYSDKPRVEISISTYHPEE